MNHTWRFPLALLASLFLSSLAYSASELSRAKAESLIMASKALSSVRLNIPFNQNGWKKGILQNTWDVDGRVGGKGSVYIQAVQDQKLRPVQPVSIVVTVTGITEAMPGIKLVVFSWRYQNLPKIVKRYVIEGGNGEAQFRLWDDGWRIDNSKIEWSKNPAPQSASEKQEDEMEEKMGLQALEATLKRSLPPTQFSKVFDVELVDIMARVKTTVIVTDTDVRFARDLFKNHFKDTKTPVTKIWFGDVMKIVGEVGGDPLCLMIGWDDHGEGQRYSYMGGGTELEVPKDTYELLKRTLTSAFQNWQSQYGSAIRKQRELGYPKIPVIPDSAQAQKELQEAAKRAEADQAVRAEIERAARADREAERNRLEKMLDWHLPAQLVLKAETTAVEGMSMLGSHVTLSLISDGIQINGKRLNGRWQFWKVSSMSLGKDRLTVKFWPQSGDEDLVIYSPADVELLKKISATFVSWKQSDLHREQMDARRQIEQLNKTGIVTSNPPSSLSVGRTVPETPPQSPSDTASQTSSRAASSSPGLTIARTLEATHPEIEILSIDDAQGTIKVRNKNDDRIVIVTLDEARKGQIVFPTSASPASAPGGIATDRPPSGVGSMTAASTADPIRKYPDAKAFVVEHLHAGLFVAPCRGVIYVFNDRVKYEAEASKANDSFEIPFREIVELKTTSGLFAGFRFKIRSGKNYKFMTQEGERVVSTFSLPQK